ncbi:MAG: hypothetical protein ACLQD8_03545 [Thermoplasmata archaeon]
MVIASATVALAEARTSAAVTAASSGVGSDPPSVVVGPPAPITLTNPDVQPAGYFGYSVAISGSIVAVAAPDETASAQTGAGEVYLVNTETGSNMVLTSPNAVHDGSFGEAVALSGTTLVVGAPFETAGGYLYAGHAYIYNAISGALLYQLTSPNAQELGYFGNSVAVGGTIAVVGAYGESEDNGAAYAVNTTTGLMNVLPNPIPDLFGSFGNSVAVNGGTIVVGAPNDPVGGSADAGLAFEFNSFTDSAVRLLSSPNAVAFGFFGTSVATNGATIVVGAPGESGPGNTGPAHSGNAYLVSEVTGASTDLGSFNPVAGGQFGSSVAISGTTATVGAFNENSEGITSAGAAYSFNTLEGDSMTSSFTSSLPVLGGEFGDSVASYGSTVVVGAPQEGSGSSDIGHAYVFQSPATTLSSSPPSFGSEFGNSVAVSGPTVVVGAYDAAGGNGGAWIFNTVTQNVIGLSDPGAPGAFFGGSVSVSGSIVLVGAPGDSGGSGDVYEFNAASGTLLHTFASPDPHPGVSFGYSVALSGSRAIIGAPEGGVSDAGNAYVFDTGSYSLLYNYSSPNAQASGLYGTSVAIKGNEAIVGAPHESSYVEGILTPNVGNTYVLNLTTHSSTQLSSRSGISGGAFGTFVAIDSVDAVVGAPDETAAGLSEAGNVYVFAAKTGAFVETLSSPDPQLGGGFGFSVAVNGITVVVGAPLETPIGGLTEYSGVVYSFDAQTGAPVSAFSSPNPVFEGELGIAVAIGGTTIVAGAPNEAAYGLASAGHAYIL